MVSAGNLKGKCRLRFARKHALAETVLIGLNVTQDARSQDGCELLLLLLLLPSYLPRIPTSQKCFSVGSRI